MFAVVVKEATSHADTMLVLFIMVGIVWASIDLVLAMAKDDDDG